MNPGEFDRVAWEDICTILMLKDWGYRPVIADVVINALEENWAKLDTAEQARKFIEGALSKLAPNHARPASQRN